MEPLAFFGDDMERAESAELCRQLAALAPEEALSVYLQSDSLLNEANKLLDLAASTNLLQLWETLLTHPLISSMVQLPLVKQAFDRILVNQLKSRFSAVSVLLSLSNAAFYQSWLAGQPQPLTGYYSQAVARLVQLLQEPTELLAAFLALAGSRVAEAYVFGLQFELAELALAQHTLNRDATWHRVAGFMWAGGRLDAAEAVASELGQAEELLRTIHTFEAWLAALPRLGGPGRRLAVLMAGRWPDLRCVDMAVSVAAGLSWMAAHQLARQAQAQHSPHTPYLLSRLSALNLTLPEATPFPWLPVPLPK